MRTMVSFRIFIHFFTGQALLDKAKNAALVTPGLLSAVVGSEFCWQGGVGCLGLGAWVLGCLDAWCLVLGAWVL